MHVRDEGHVLSSMDQHLIATWWERGYPLVTVLRTVRETAERLKKRKRPPRGLPLRSMAKVVEREGARAAERMAARGQIAAPQDGSELSWARDRVVTALAGRGPGHLSFAALRDAESALAAEAGADPSGVFVALLRIARSYYDALVARMPSDERAALRQTVAGGLDARRMAPDAYEATVTELLRRALVEGDPVLDLRQLTEDDRQ